MTFQIEGAFPRSPVLSWRTVNAPWRTGNGELSPWTCAPSRSRASPNPETDHIGRFSCHRDWLADERGKHKRLEGRVILNADGACTVAGLGFVSNNLCVSLSSDTDTQLAANVFWAFPSSKEGLGISECAPKETSDSPNASSAMPSKREIGTRVLFDVPMAQGQLFGVSESGEGPSS